MSVSEEREAAEATEATAFIDAIQAWGVPGWKAPPPPSPEKEAELRAEAVQPAVSPDPGWGSMPGDFDEDGDQRRIVHWAAVAGPDLWVRLRPAFTRDDWWMCDPAHLHEEDVLWWQDPEHRAAWRDGAERHLFTHEITRAWQAKPGPSPETGSELAPWLDPNVMDEYVRARAGGGGER